MNGRQALVLVLAAAGTWHALAPAHAVDAVSSPAGDDAQDILFLAPTRPVLIRLRVTLEGKPFRQAWRERFDEAFKLEDRDSDEKLAETEALGVMREMDGTLAEKAAPDLKSALAGGTIDRATLASLAERTLPPFLLRPRAAAGQGSALALFPLLDANGDNRLSAEELAAAELRLRQRDFDDNGTITAGELILDPKAIAAAADPTADRQNAEAADSPVIAIGAATTASQIADRLLKHYDRDRDGRLTTEGPGVEIKLPATWLGELDKNGDRVLVREEMEHATWPVDLELAFAMGQAASGTRAARSRRIEESPQGFKVRRKLTGGYDVDLGDAQIDFDRNNRDPRQADLVQLRTYDRDNNSYIDVKEAAAASIGKAAFAAMDVDGDGKVFKGELTSFMSRQNEAAAVRLHLIVRDLGQDLFTRMDADRDGLLSARELRQARSVLEFDDKNSDGLLALDEIPARLELELVRGVDENATAEARMGRRVARVTSQAETTGPLWFRKMDRNNDGDLSPGEFIGPRAAFERLDADHDGLVDRDEAEAADKRSGPG